MVRVYIYQFLFNTCFKTLTFKYSYIFYPDFHYFYIKNLAIQWKYKNYFIMYNARLSFVICQVIEHRVIEWYNRQWRISNLDKMYMRTNVLTRRIAHECAEEFKYNEKAQKYKTYYIFLFHQHRKFAGHINLTYDQTRFLMEQAQSQ